MRRIAAAVAACLMLGVAHAAEETSAAERNPLDSRFIVDVGYFFLSTDTRVRVDGETSDQVGSDINFDDTFCRGEVGRFRVDGLWRIAPRHLIRAMYCQNYLHATRSIERDVNFQDETFPV